MRLLWAADSNTFAARPLSAALGISPRYVASSTNTDQHFAAVVELLEPRGHIAVIDDPKSLDIVPLKRKALAVSWEFMFTRSMFQTADMDVPHRLLNRVADLLDEGMLMPTVNRHGGILSVANLRSITDLLEIRDSLVSRTRHSSRAFALAFAFRLLSSIKETNCEKEHSFKGGAWISVATVGRQRLCREPRRL